MGLEEGGNRGCHPSYLNYPEGIPQFAEGIHHIAYAIYHISEGNTLFSLLGKTSSGIAVIPLRNAL